uniref:Uncharacterized protein n=1 Tax=viral metagenome TaxID=1070528 RepID=A0A6M3KEI3_9ZZZZ
MKGMLILILLLPLFLTAQNKDVYVRGGYIFINVKIIEDQEKYIKVDLISEERIIIKTVITNIVDTEFQDRTPAIIEPDKKPAPTIIMEKQQQKLITDQLIPLKLSLLGLSLALVYDNFYNASLITDTIDDFKKAKLNTSDLENQRTPKYVVGIAALITAVVISYDLVSNTKVSASPHGINLSYKYNF